MKTDLVEEVERKVMMGIDWKKVQLGIYAIVNAEIKFGWGVIVLKIMK